MGKIFAVLQGYKVYLLVAVYAGVSIAEFAGVDVVDGITQANALQNLWGALLLAAGRSTAEQAIKAIKGE